MIGMGFLSACSLEQRTSGNQVRIQIDPSVIRGATSPVRSASLNSREDSIPQDDSLVPTTSQTYLLINVEGPGIPFVEYPKIPCIKLAIGSSVLVPLSAVNSEMGSVSGTPVELWVPAGENRVVSLYAIDIFPTIGGSFPAFGASASQFFMGEVSVGLPFYHAQAIVPSLFGEQTVELIRNPAPQVVQCSGGLDEPPVLIEAEVALSKYRPYFTVGVNPNAPAESGVLKAWKPASGLPWILRVSGELSNLGQAQVWGISANLAVGTASPAPPTSGASNIANGTSIPSGGRFWFQENYPISTSQFYSSGSLAHKVNFYWNSGAQKSIERTIPFDVSPSPAPVVIESINSIAQTSNLYAMTLKPVGTSSALVLPLRRDSLFSGSGVIGERVEVLMSRPSESVATETLCPVGESGSPFYLTGSGCKIYFVALGLPSSVPTRIELDAASLPLGNSAPEFRQAQLALTPLTSSSVGQTRDFDLSGFPRPDSGVQTPIQIPYNLSGYAPLDEGSIVSAEISGEGFRKTWDKTASEPSPPAGISLNGASGYFLNNLYRGKCITRMSVLVKGKMAGSTLDTYRRENFELSPCGTPDIASIIPQNVLATASTTGSSATASVLLNWMPVLGTGITYLYDIYRCENYSTTWTRIKESYGLTSYTDTDRIPGFVYEYKVRAVTSSGLEGPDSDVASVKPISSMIVPSVFVNSDAGPNALFVAWSSVPEATHYLVKWKLQSADDVESNWTSVIPQGTNSTTINGLNGGLSIA